MAPVRVTQDALLIYLPSTTVGVRVTQDSLLIFKPLPKPPSPALPGYGSHLRYSTDGTVYINFLYLKSFSPSGLESQMLDTTGINPSSLFKTKLATLIDGGKVS